MCVKVQHVQKLPKSDFPDRLACLSPPLISGAMSTSINPPSIRHSTSYKPTTFLPSPFSLQWFLPPFPYDFSSRLILPLHHITHLREKAERRPTNIVATFCRRSREVDLASAIALDWLHFLDIICTVRETISPSPHRQCTRTSRAITFTRHKRKLVFKT